MCNKNNILKCLGEFPKSLFTAKKSGEPYQ